MKKIALALVLVGVFGAYLVIRQVSFQSKTPTSDTTPTVNKTVYKNGEYTSPVADAVYGPLQIKVVVNDQKISDVQFLQYPNNKEPSITINKQAILILKLETIVAQNADIEAVSGATATSKAYIESLKTILSRAI